MTNLVPHDKDAKMKFTLAKKEQRLRLFAESIEKESNIAKLDLSKMVIPHDYSGPVLPMLDVDEGVECEGIDQEWVLQLMVYLAKQNLLHKKVLTYMVLKLKRMFEVEQSLVDLDVQEYVFFEGF